MSAGEQPHLENLARRLVQARQELARVRAEVDDLRTSTSWRITSPLRLLAGVVRGKGALAAAPARKVVPDPRIPGELLRSDFPDASSDDSFRLVDCTPHLAGLLSDEAVDALLSDPDSGGREWSFGREGAQSIALISGPTLAAEFAFDVPVLRLSPRDAAEVLRCRSPAFLLVDTDVHDMPPEWRSELWAADGRLRSVMAECTALGIPVVLWLRCDPEDYPNLKQLALVADRVYAIDHAVHERVRSDVDAAKLGLMGPWIQPRLHNPLRTDALTALKPSGQFRVLHDALADASALSPPLGALPASVSAWLVDSYWDVSAARAEAMSSNAGVSLGRVGAADKLALIRLVDAELFTPSLIRPAWTTRQEMLRAAASGALVVADPAVHDAWPLRSVAPFASSIDECVRCASDELSAAVWRRRVADELLAGHTCLEALTCIRRDLGLDPSARTTMVSCLLVTRRPARIHEALDNFRRQAHPCCELIVVLHGHSGNGAEVPAGSRRVVVLQAPMSMSLGDCLNLAVSHARGAYWAKMDDDDYYAPEYLMRIHALLEASAAEVVGMPLLFTRFESDHAAYCDLPRLASAARVGEGWRRGEICGATLAGTTDLLRRIPFSSRRRSGVDSQFLDDCSRQGIRVAVGDGFGYLCQRSSDASQHTWEGDEDGVRARGVRLDPAQYASAGLPE